MFTHSHIAVAVTSLEFCVNSLVRAVKIGQQFGRKDDSTSESQHSHNKKTILKKNY